MVEKKTPTAVGKKQVERETVKRYIARVSDYNTVFGSPLGKKVLEDMFKAHGMLNSTFNSNSLESAYKEGQRSVVLRILQIMNFKPEHLKQVIDQMEMQNANKQ